jgi:endonuclease/exonuclease/phosphatase family metal-dependent hydrolase
VLTWNIGNIYLNQKSYALDRDLPHVAEVIKNIDPDIASLQEIRDKRQLKRLLRLLDYRYKGAIPLKDRYDRKVGLLVKGERPKFESVPVKQGRSAISVTLSFKRGSLIFIGVHLSSFDGLKRHAQILQILDWISKKGLREVILCGDFNFDPLWPQEEFDQAWYSLLTQRFLDLGKGIKSTTLLGKRLDSIFLRTAKLRRYDIKVIQGKRRGWMDHDPLVADLELFFQPAIM